MYITETVIHCKPEITISGIDSKESLSQLDVMLTADEIREELIRQLDDKKVVGAKVASKLNIAPARVTEMRKRTRQVQQDEMQPLAEYLGMIPPTPSAIEPIAEVAQIRHVGEVAQGVWLEQTYNDPDEPEFVPYDRRIGDPGASDLFAVTPKGDSMNLRFLDPNIRLICHSTTFTDSILRDGDLVIVEREAHDLRELTCKRVEIDDNGVYWLHSESDNPKFQKPWQIGKPNNGDHHDSSIRIIGRVLRGVVDYT